nr:hypothetical protein HJG59_008492 [Molossus molossus]
MCSAAAWFVVMGAIQLYVLIQYQMNPTILRMDPHYENTASDSTWLLFLPYFHLKVKTTVVGVIWLLILILIMSSLVMVGKLLVFHMYLLSKRMSTYDYLTRDRKQHSSGVTSRKKTGCFRIQISSE